MDLIKKVNTMCSSIQEECNGGNNRSTIGSAGDLVEIWLQMQRVLGKRIYWELVLGAHRLRKNKKSARKKEDRLN